MCVRGMSEMNMFERFELVGIILVNFDYLLKGVDCIL